MDSQQSDPSVLSFLRELTITGQKATLSTSEDGKSKVLTLGSHGAYPFDTLTLYKSKNADSYYTLGAVWFLLKEHQNKISQYVLNATQNQIPIVSLLDRKDLVDYVTGVTNGSDQIIVPTHVPAVSKRPHEQTKASDSGEHDLSKEEIESIKKKRKKKEQESRFDGSCERVLRDRHSVLLYPAKNMDFSRVADSAKLVLHAEKNPQKIHAENGSHRVDSGRPTATASSSTAIASTSAATSQPIASLPPKGTVRPIILLPNSATALINQYNAKEFFGENKFVNVRGVVAEKAPMVRVYRTVGKNMCLSYDISDTPAKLSKQDWSRVACVVVSGQTWQLTDIAQRCGLKTTEANFNPANVFEKMLGVYFHVEGREIDATVKQWNVTRLAISETERYKDAPIVLQFWNTLDRYIATFKPHLAQKPRPRTNK